MPMYPDTAFTLYDYDDQTRMLQFDCSLLTGFKTVSVPETGTLDLIDVAQTISAKKTYPSNGTDCPKFQGNWTLDLPAIELHDTAWEGSPLLLSVYAKEGGDCYLHSGIMVSSGTQGTLAALGTGLLKNTTTTGVLSIAAASDLPAHSVLSASHGDTTAAAVARGSLIAGIGATPKWEGLAAGAQGNVLVMGASEPGWLPPTAISENTRFYLWDTASGVTGYDTLSQVPPTEAQQDDYADCVGGGGNTWGTEVLCESYMTKAGSPGQLVIPAGQWDFNFWGYVDSAVGSSRLVYKVYHCAADGSGETLIFSKTGEVNIASINIAAPTALANSYFTATATNLASTTSRLVVKMYVQTNSNNTRRVHFLHSGSVFASHVHTPISGAALVHNLLSALHQDTTAASPTAGNLIYGVGSPAKWESSTPAAAGITTFVGTPYDGIGLTGDNTAQTILTASHAAGFYRISVYCQTTTAGAAGSVTKIFCVYNDGTSTKTSHVGLNNIYDAAYEQTFRLTNTVLNYNGVRTFYSSGSAAITVYNAGGTYNTNPVFNIRARLEYLGA